MATPPIPARVSASEPGSALTIKAVTPSIERVNPHRPHRAGVPDHEGAIAGAAYTRHRRIHRSRSHPRPRILQLLATGGNGGAQESYTGLLLRLDRSRYEVRALSLSAGSAVQRLRALGVAVDVVDETDDELAVRELAAWLRREEIDLVHAHMYRAEVLGTQRPSRPGRPSSCPPSTHRASARRRTRPFSRRSRRRSIA